jgi:hypothetical protein
LLYFIKKLGVILKSKLLITVFIGIFFVACSAKNPNKNEKIEHKSPIELVENIKLNNALINDLLDEVEEILIGKSVE